MVSTFSAFSVARLGMYAATQAIQVTGNNIANINTDGYTKQKLDQFSLYSGIRDSLQSNLVAQLGHGVLAPSVSHNRDIYLDIRYRDENTEVGNLEAMQNGLNRISALLDDVSKGEDDEGMLEGLYNNMVEQLDTLANEGAGQDQYDALFRSAMSSFVNELNKTSRSLDVLAEAKASDFEEDLEHTNALIDRIRELNTNIRKNHIFGDSALEQEDQRNLLLDELSYYMDIDVVYTEEMVGSIAVEKIQVYTQAGGENEPERLLIDGIFAGNIYRRDEEDSTFDLNIGELEDVNGNTKIVRVIDRGAIKNRDIEPYMDEEIAQAMAYHSMEDAEAMAEYLNDQNENAGTEWRVVVSDAGEIQVHLFGTTVYSTRDDALQALINLDKDYGKTVTESGEVLNVDFGIVQNGEQYEIHQIDKFKGEVLLGDTELGGAILGDREILTEMGSFASAEYIERDADSLSKRGIPYYQKAMDVLANQLATVLNGVNQMDDEVIYRNRENADGSYTFLDADGNPTTDRSQYVLKDEYKNYNGGVLLSNNPTGNDDTGIDAGNISISSNWASGTLRTLRSREPNSGSTASDNLLRMSYLVSTQKYSFMPNTEGVYEDAASDEPFFYGTIQELMTNHIESNLADDSNNTDSQLLNYQLMANELYVSRDGVIGVDLNDEAMDIMKYQKAYNAACQLVTAFDEMLDRLINGMGGR